MLSRLPQLHQSYFYQCNGLLSELEKPCNWTCAHLFKWDQQVCCSLPQTSESDVLVLLLLYLQLQSNSPLQCHLLNWGIQAQQREVEWSCTAVQPRSLFFACFYRCRSIDHREICAFCLEYRALPVQTIFTLFCVKWRALVQGLASSFDVEIMVPQFSSCSLGYPVFSWEWVFFSARLICLLSFSQV